MCIRDRLNIGGQIQFTNAQTVYDLNGKSTNIGASGGDGPYLGLDLISFSPPNDPNGKIDGISASAGLGTVSYTHLDVYKRQRHRHPL